MRKNRPRAIVVMERARALTMRRDGLTLREVAGRLGVCCAYAWTMTWRAIIDEFRAQLGRDPTDAELDAELRKLRQAYRDHSRQRHKTPAGYSRLQRFYAGRAA